MMWLRRAKNKTGVSSATVLLQKLQPLPAGFEAFVVSAMGDYLGDGRISNDFQVTISGTYAGRMWHEMYYLHAEHLAFISAVRDKLMTRHWRRAQALTTDPIELGKCFVWFSPFSKMEQLNYAQ